MKTITVPGKTTEITVRMKKTPEPVAATECPVCDAVWAIASSPPWFTITPDGDNVSADIVMSGTSTAAIQLTLCGRIFNITLNLSTIGS